LASHAPTIPSPTARELLTYEVCLAELGACPRALLTVTAVVAVAAATFGVVVATRRSDHSVRLGFVRRRVDGLATSFTVPPRMAAGQNSAAVRVVSVYAALPTLAVDIGHSTVTRLSGRTASMKLRNVSTLRDLLSNEIGADFVAALTLCRSFAFAR
jgi:hypothetical protein